MGPDSLTLLSQHVCHGAGGGGLLWTHLAHMNMQICFSEDAGQGAVCIRRVLTVVLTQFHSARYVAFYHRKVRLTETRRDRQPCVFCSPPRSLPPPSVNDTGCSTAYPFE